jgi:putative ABC transport system ATP-binding protein
MVEPESKEQPESIPVQPAPVQPAPPVAPAQASPTEEPTPETPLSTDATTPMMPLNTDAEAALLFQRDGEEQEADPMMQAIQQEMGQRLNAATGLTTEVLNEREQEPYTDDEVFRADNLTKAYGKGAAYLEVIKGISFVVKEGEYIVILGPSGAGKSTLLHLLAGLEVPTRGEIRIRNTPFSALSEDEIALYHREGVGLVFQNFNLLNTLPVWENVAFPLMLSGAPLEWRRHEALKVLDQFGLADFANHYPNQLSGGQQQRVSLARALIHDPALLLIDEPTGNLDSRSAEIVIKEITRLHKEERRTIILVTHSQTFIPYATRVFYIRDGTLLTSNEQNSLDPV